MFSASLLQAIFFGSIMLASVVFVWAIVPGLPSAMWRNHRGCHKWGFSMGGIPKWMVYFMENPNLKWMFQDGFIFETFEVKLGVASLFLGDVWEQISR